MREFTFRPLLVLVVLALSCYGLHSEELIGLWKTGAEKWNPPDQTNTFLVSQTAEFRKDRSFKITTATKDASGKEVEMPGGGSGTYKLVDTNHVQLELIPNPSMPDYKLPIVVSFSISNDVLELPALVVSDGTVPTLKYRRVK